MIMTLTALIDAFDETSETVKEEYQNLVKRSTLTVLGQGIIGNIVSDQTYIEYGAVLINTDNEKEFRITNPSKCDIDFDLKIYKRIMEEERKKNETNTKENNNNTTSNDLKLGDLEKQKTELLNNDNITINGNNLNNDVFDFNNYMKTMDDKMDYINEKDYEKEELIDKNDTGIIL
ncbi:hypothetical protein PIROE2DRAFT_16983 [Piromyces sp. E2]|nr:hypothetical protein PIROE2DRAFT_16983 [Piromyces sp. E2]|eukprot:OUM57892.1 hypothetical protein PIROE2DRAFT_16983 [Piromyces sp. E2]